MDATDAALIERTADSAIATGNPVAAMKLLKVLRDALRHERNRFMADVIDIKLLQLASKAGDRGATADSLERLRPTIGSLDAIEFDAAGLEQFERRCLWPDVLPHERAFFFVSFYRAVSGLLAWLGQYGNAAAALRRALDQLEMAADAATADAAAIHLDLAAVMLGCGDIPACRKELSAAGEIGGPVDRARKQELLAHCEMLNGEFAAAESAFRRALGFCDALSLVHAGVIIRLNLCYLLIILNRTVEAEELTESCAAVARGLSVGALADRIIQMQRLVSARRTSTSRSFAFAPANIEQWGQHRPSARADRDAPPLLELPTGQSSSLLERLGDYTLGIYQLFEARMFDESDRWLASMREIFSASDSPLIGLRLSLLECMSLYYRGDFRQAITRLEKVCDELRSRQLRHDLWVARSFSLWCATRLGKPEAHRQRIIEEIGLLTDSMANGLSPAQRAMFEVNKWNSEEAEFAMRVERLATAGLRNCKRPAIFRALLLLPAVARLDRLVADMDSRRVASLTARHARPHGKPWWLRLLFARRDRVTVSFFTLPDRLVVIRESFLLLDISQFPTARLLLREQVRQWHESMANHAKRDQAPRLAGKIVESLHLAELLDRPHEWRQLRVVPDDVLHGLPFCALRWRNRYLVQQVTLTTDTCHVPLAAPTIHSRPDTGTVVAMGLPTLDTIALPGVNVEARSVMKRLRNSGLRVTPLTDQAATKPAVLQALGESDIVHVACHGTFEPDDMRRTGLLLYGDGEKPGLLSLWDVINMPEMRARLVSLSSCWSADNYILPGRHVVSVPQAFRAGGVRSVVSCLWPVDDSIAILFFDRFHELSASRSHADALRQTQIEFLEARLRDGTSSEYHWAGFVLNTSG